MLFLLGKALYYSSNSSCEPSRSKHKRKERSCPYLAIEPIPQNAAQQHTDNRKEGQLKRHSKLA